MTPTQLQQLSVKYDIWVETLKDIMKDLTTPPHDQREDFEPPSFASDFQDIKNLQVGTILEGVVRNITDFGAFVDIGLHNDGLVHKSQMADRFVSHPIDVVSLWQKVKVRVLEIDHEKEKISLSMKGVN
jgi:protein Tex